MIATIHIYTMLTGTGHYDTGRWIMRISLYFKRSLLIDNPPSPGKVEHTTGVYVPCSFRSMVWVLLLSKALKFNHQARRNWKELTVNRQSYNPVQTLINSLRSGAFQTPTLIIISREQEGSGPGLPQNRVAPTSVGGAGNDGIAVGQRSQQPMDQVWNLVVEFKNTFVPLRLQ